MFEFDDDLLDVLPSVVRESFFGVFEVVVVTIGLHARHSGRQVKQPPRINGEACKGLNRARPLHLFHRYMGKKRSKKTFYGIHAWSSDVQYRRLLGRDETKWRCRCNRP